jgi:hypothetical protein
MSKQVTDILGRMQGNVLALKGMYDKLAVPVGPTNPTFEQTPIPAPMAPNATHEDYTYVQKLLKEIESQAQSASAEIDKILQVPPPPGTEPPPEISHQPGSPGAPTHQPASASHKK